MVHRQPDPKDRTVIEMEPLTPRQSPSPTRLALFHKDGPSAFCGPATTALRPRPDKRKALVAATGRRAAFAGGVLRITPGSCATPATKTTTLFGKEVTGPLAQIAPRARPVLVGGAPHTPDRRWLATGTTDGRCPACVLAELPGPDDWKCSPCSTRGRRGRHRLSTRTYSVRAGPVRWRSSTPCSTTATRRARRYGRRKTSPGLRPAEEKRLGVEASGTGAKSAPPGLHVVGRPDARIAGAPPCPTAPCRRWHR